ncbi:hypothetical protein E2562_006974 [Oryza meyeriana var. granulata]|uniref:Sodium/calcium exchanger membrane region domain-containing protein n=1 Tax=Oryza meyeriana var. granulata TaxID=110450 RepID=A0A6G1EA00_9ORYZ|nr:hypothetical protein E2562_006974 [Oryza meyeriana var. granulata]
MMGAEKAEQGMEELELEAGGGGSPSPSPLTATAKMQALDFEHIGSLAAVAESLSPGSKWRRAFTSVRVVILQAKINVLLPFGPLAVMLHYLTGKHQGWVFLFSLIGITPLAERLGYATEQLALYTGPTIGGLLNATFGNATEMIISLYALKNGMIRVVQQSLLGSILSNMLLVLGCAFFAGGLVHPSRDQVFNKASAVVNSGLLLMAVLGLMFPAVLHFTHSEVQYGKSEVSLSRFSSCIMLVAYASYLFFQLKSQRSLYSPISEQEEEAIEDEEDEKEITQGEAICWLFVLTIWISILSGYLVDAIQLWAPVLGPQHPHAPISSASGNRNHKLGHVEDAAVLPFLFDEQYNTFHRFGYAADPSGLHIVGDAQPKVAEPDTVYNLAPSEHKRRRLQSKTEDADQEPLPPEAKNPASDEWILRNKQSPWAGKKEAPPAELTEEQRQYAEAHAAKKAEKEARGEGKGEKSDMVVKSTFHGKEERDYQGRSWITPPKDAKASNERCYIPKRCVHEWVGHTKGYWDTETGQVISTFSTGKVPYVVKLNPDEDKQHILLAGMSDKKIVQWDMKSGQITQEYDQHLGAVNTITFVDNNRRFVTSSDDKSLRVWEFGIPVVIKYISEPHMHSMPSITLHPNSNWLAAQSLDNQILIYSTKERFQLNKKKRFAGHIVAGYACQVNFSPDGRFVMSGDGEGIEVSGNVMRKVAQECCGPVDKFM